MPIDNGKPTLSGVLLVFYDLESTQETLMPDGSFLHIPNLCVYQQHCEYCIDTDIRICICGIRQQVLKIDPVSRFMEYIMNQRQQFKKIFVIGHAGGLYDNQFMLSYILTSTDLKPELITRGTKLLLMSVGNVKFIDSLNYFPMPLSKLPKAFGLKDVKKGYFPHLFNKKENWNYIGPLPALEYYDPDNLKYTPTLDENTDSRQQLVDWHKENKNYVFDFQKEIIAYCISDVDILSRACLKFREMIIKEGRVDPFTEAITLPGACNKIFRRNFLKPNMIGLVPKNGYRYRDKQSKIAVQWLIWEGHQRGINIIHAANGTEAVLAGVKVDGFCKETNQIFEFHGCYFHGCIKCIKYKRDEPLHEDPTSTIEARYESTLMKTQRLLSLGYEVIEKWECDFTITEEILTFTENHPLISFLPLEPRDAFYGGRTDATKLYHKCAKEEKIKYVDVCSLYPWVNKYGKYPIGHPQVFVGDKCKTLDLYKTDGLIKCKILPPQNLYHAVLPIKSNNKLMFSLCRTCCENMSNECVHNHEERVISGTWVIDEVLKALEKGYKMIEIYEIWKYETVQYDPNTKTGGLFSEYISNFLKIKQQASGWPVDCKSIVEKEKYITEYFDKEGVSLCADEIEYNPGRRQIGKSVITSFWGKLGQKDNQDKTSIVSDTAEFFDILSKPFIEVNSVFPVNEKTLLVNWVFKNEAYDVLPTVNVVLAAYTTALARLKLYSFLEKLDKKVLYHDTDSVIYVSRPGEYEVPLGSFLGEMTDELAEYGEGSYITDFVSGGPKLYAYRVYSTAKNKTLDLIKVKGITLNYNTSELVNFEKLRDMVLNEAPNEYISTKNILRNTDHTVVTKEVTKVFRTNFTKRKRIDNYDSVPYGYKKQKFESFAK
ncbi:unnamed protein product [Psylliodes chrysocephalus]|uniref:DNA-directed DNA polymerase n=1 Tax=Psylliodes chrysocephalus TaxID=3402493 RepID=A0A9P0DAP8_9CUCU|nr:unnamed protein product [Psylliodes chrysocephala]